METALKKIDAIAAAKSFRQRLDELLQEMKEHKTALINRYNGPVCALVRPMISTPEEIEAARIERAKFDAEQFIDQGEVIAQHTISIRDLESAIMRLGMELKYIGTPDPYPHSKDPSSPVVEPTADSLKM